MGSKPKQQDYEASEAEKASAAVAKAEKDFFNQKYGPKLVEMKNIARNYRFGDAIRGRANADTMQALTGKVTFNNVIDIGGDDTMSGAISGQLQKADAATKGIENKLGAGVLGTARGQAADAQTGMRQASRLATSAALTRAKARQDAAAARFDMGVGLSIAGATRAKDEYDKGTFG